MRTATQLMSIRVCQEDVGGAVGRSTAQVQLCIWVEGWGGLGSEAGDDRLLRRCNFLLQISFSLS
jgi:hypothetical protein